MLQHTEHTPGVEMVLLTKSFAVVKNDVCVMTSQVYLMMLFANSEAGATWVVFLGVAIDYNPSIRDIFQIFSGIYACFI